MDHRKGTGSTLQGGHGGESLEQNWATSDLSGESSGDEEKEEEEEEQQQQQQQQQKESQGDSSDMHKASSASDSMSQAIDSTRKRPAVAHIPRGNMSEQSQAKRQRRGKRGSLHDEDAPLLQGTSRMIRDHIWQLYTNAIGARLSQLEQEDTRPSEDCFFDTKSHDNSNAAEIVKTCLEDWKVALKKAAAFGGKKSPTVLVVSGNSNRACAIIKQLNGLGLKLPIAKLFSRHMKVKQQKEMLANRGFACGVGTPNRILKLLDLEFLNLKRTKLIILDMSRDLKGYHMLKQRDTAMDTALLFQRHMFVGDRDLRFATLV